MPTKPHFARRFRLLALLQASLVAGALYDLGFGLCMVVAPGLPGRLLHLPLPGEPFYLWVMAILLGMLAVLYLLAARDSRRYSGVIAVGVVGRLAGALAFALAGWSHPHLMPGIAFLAAGDFVLGLAPALFWLPLRQ